MSKMCSFCGRGLDATHYMVECEWSDAKICDQCICDCMRIMIGRIGKDYQETIEENERLKEQVAGIEKAVWGDAHGPDEGSSRGV